MSCAAENLMTKMVRRAVNLSVRSCRSMEIFRKMPSLDTAFQKPEVAGFEGKIGGGSEIFELQFRRDFVKRFKRIIMLF